MYMEEEHTLDCNVVQAVSDEADTRMELEDFSRLPNSFYDYFEVEYQSP